MLYLGIKWLHLVALISWMAGILYLYRLLVYHAENGSRSEDNHILLHTMESRLYRIITLPAMAITWLCGLSMLALNPAVAKGQWFHWKLLLVILMTGSTHYAGALIKKFQARNPKVPSSKALRILNEVPTLLMVLIIALVVFRPF